MRDASGHSNFISHTPVKQTQVEPMTHGSVNQSAPSASLLQSFFSAISHGAISVPNYLVRNFLPAVADGKSINQSKRRRKPHSSLGQAADDDPLVLAEDDLFHNKVVTVLVLIGVLLLIIFGGTAIFVLDVPSREARGGGHQSEVVPVATLPPPKPLEMQHDEALMRASHEKAKILSTESIESLPPPPTLQLAHPNDHPLPSHLDTTTPHPSELPHITPAPVDTTKSTKASRRASKLHISLGSPFPTPLSTPFTHSSPSASTKHTAASTPARRLPYPPPSSSPTASSPPQPQGPQPRRYGPVSKHRVTVDTLFYASPTSKDVLGELAAGSIVALVEDAKSGVTLDPKLQRVHITFQPRDLKTRLNTVSIPSLSKKSTTASSTAVANSVVPPGDVAYLGEGWLSLTTLTPLPHSEWRRFALAIPQLPLPSGEPSEDYARGTDHGEVWMIDHDEREAAAALVAQLKQPHRFDAAWDVSAEIAREEREAVQKLRRGGRPAH